jgi:hypothetical protein
LDLDLHPYSAKVFLKSRMFRIHRLENGEVVFTISGRIEAEHIAELKHSSARKERAAASFST